MSFSKAPLFEDNLYFTALICKACAHPARLVILERLIDQDGFTSFEVLKEGIPLAGTTVSQHLKALRDMGFIRSRATNSKTTEHKLNNRMKHAKELIDLITNFGKDRHSLATEVSAMT